MHVGFVRCTYLARNNEIGPVEYYARVMSLMSHCPVLFEKFKLLLPDINKAIASYQENPSNENISQDYTYIDKLLMEIASRIRQKEDFENKPSLDLAEEVREAFARSDTSKFRKVKKTVSYTHLTLPTICSV
eukprot:TRINITY_DN9962_c0_g2_i1.p1 TRINITY_DN9962_c0_g2~~TRINITY_DN9962_c0_g2_i1.p1  ORF type:complete len:132 (-),score=19.11 TRINITY_DN9962_c0_g2_i1:35-430(-)